MNSRTEHLCENVPILPTRQNKHYARSGLITYKNSKTTQMYSQLNNMSKGSSKRCSKINYANIIKILLTTLKVYLQAISCRVVACRMSALKCDPVPTIKN